MKYEFGIIAAMDEETEEIKKIMCDLDYVDIFNIKFITGKINSKNVVLVKSGVGKVNAAITTQMLIDNFDIEKIINVGSGAGVKDNIDIGDIVIAQRLYQHDFDITAFGHKKGYISNIGEYIETDKLMQKELENVIKNLEDEKISARLGIIASGDIFCTDEKMKNKIKEKFNADIIEMEGAAIAQACYICKKPFIVIRSVSDKPNGENNITFEEFLKLASSRCADIINNYIR